MSTLIGHRFENLKIFFKEFSVGWKPYNSAENFSFQYVIGKISEKSTTRLHPVPFKSFPIQKHWWKHFSSICILHWKQIQSSFFHPAYLLLILLPMRHPPTPPYFILQLPTLLSFPFEKNMISSLSLLWWYIKFFFFKKKEQNLLRNLSSKWL